MSSDLSNLIVAIILALHGIAHYGAYIGQIYDQKGLGTGKWKVAKSWLFPDAYPSTVMRFAGALWLLCMIAFLATATSIRGVIISQDMWEEFGVVAALISSIGILLFIGNWPKFNTTAALCVNILTLTQVFLNWPLKSVL